MDQTYEIRPSAGKGWGCFARRDIMRGTKIITERPLMHIYGKTSQCVAAFWGLTVDDKRKYLLLHGSKADVRAFKAYDLLSPDVHDAIGNNVKEIYKINALTGASGNETMIGFIVSRMNHSCLPNTEYTQSDEDGLFKFWAVKNIAEGEEITLSYVDEFEPYERRKQILEERWKIVCDCDACDLTTEFGKTSDCRRAVMWQDRRDVLEHNKSKIDKQRKSPFKDGDKGALNAVLEVLDMMRLEGLAGGEIPYLGSATNLALKLGDMNTAIRHMTALVAQESAFEPGFTKDPGTTNRRLEQMVQARNQSGIVWDVADLTVNDDLTLRRFP